MSRNGSGTYSLPSGNPVVTGTVISSTWANNTLNDIASALTTSVASDGQTPITANIPMAGYKLTGLAAATIDGDAIRYQQVFPSLSTTTVAVGAGGLSVTSTGTLSVASGNTFLGQGLYTGQGVSTGDAVAQIGYSRSGDGNAILRFHSTNDLGSEAGITRNSGANGAMDIAQTGTASIRFYQGATNVASITAAGILQVNSSSTDGMIQAESTSTSQSTIGARSPVSFTGTAFYSNSAATAGTTWNHFYGNSSGPTANVVIYGNGNIQNANNSYGAISDARLKDKIEDAPLMRDRALLVRLVTYVLKADPDQKRLGVIAQEIKDVFPGLIEESQYRDAKGLPTGETYLTVKYSVLSLILYKAWQESEALRTSQIDALTKRIEALEAK